MWSLKHNMRVDDYRLEVVAVVMVVMVMEVVCGTGGGAGVEHGTRSVQDEVTNGGQKGLQSILYSIEERLRGLDLVYAPRYLPRHWDTEQYTRRLDAIDARIGRVEALLELRLDKVVEAVGANHMKQSLFNDQMSRKIDTLYDRLNHRIGYTENRLELDVAKIKSNIESGFARIARTERESESIMDADMESQLIDMQKQFDGFESNQNITMAMLADITNNSCRKSELNDAGNPGREFDKKDIEMFATSMEEVATKVNKMVTDFSHRAQTMESHVKNSMSLSNATRRELQDGLRSLGLRLVYHGTKHNKEKESSFEFGWDALASLITKEFSNLGTQLRTNQDKLTSAQESFRVSCYRLQENEQQLSATVAQVLDRMLDLIHNRSAAVEKQFSTFQEILKHHNSNMLTHTNTAVLRAAQHSRELEVTTSDKIVTQKMQNDIEKIMASMQVMQDQILEISTHLSEDGARQAYPDTSVMADKILSFLKQRSQDISSDNATSQIVHQVTEGIHANLETLLRDVIRKTSDTFSNGLETHEKQQTKNTGDGLERKTELLDRVNVKNENDKHEDAVKINAEHRRNVSVFDIPEEELGETLQYNVTDNGKVESTDNENEHRKEDKEPLDYDFDKISDKTEQLYYDELEAMEEQHTTSGPNEELNENDSVNSTMETSIKQGENLNANQTYSTDEVHDSIHTNGRLDDRNSDSHTRVKDNSAMLQDVEKTTKETKADDGILPIDDNTDALVDSGNKSVVVSADSKSSDIKNIHKEINVSVVKIDINGSKENAGKLVINEDPESKTRKGTKVEAANFSEIWHRIKNNRAGTKNTESDKARGDTMEGHSEGQINTERNVTENSEVERSKSEEELKKEEDDIEIDNQDLRFLDRVQLTNDAEDYDYEN